MSFFSVLYKSIVFYLKCTFLTQKRRSVSGSRILKIYKKNVSTCDNLRRSTQHVISYKESFVKVIRKKKTSLFQSLSSILFLFMYRIRAIIRENMGSI